MQTSKSYGTATVLYRNDKVRNASSAWRMSNNHHELSHTGIDPLMFKMNPSYFHKTLSNDRFLSVKGTVSGMRLCRRYPCPLHTQSNVRAEDKSYEDDVRERVAMEQHESKHKMSRFIKTMRLRGGG